MTLEIIAGDLRASRKFENGTFQHIDQLFGGELIQQPCLYAADGHGYFVKNNMVKWAITRAPCNPLLRSLDDVNFQKVCEEFFKRGNHKLNPEETQAMVKPKSTEVFDVESLQTFSGLYSNHQMGVIRIKTANGGIYSMPNWNQPSELQEKMMKRLGLTQINMQKLYSNGVTWVNVKLLDTKYVKGKLRGGGSLWRASLLTKCDDELSIHADYNSVDDNAWICGKIDQNPGQHATLKGTVSPIYQKILENPEKAVRGMNDETAAGLLRIIADYKKLKNQSGT